ncbi:inositol phosphophingolipids phospholipase C [Peniophora sp. CONT]|nr:inositol phosphophingolipids phospholipase C [Peniophora sp. CONT]
MSEKELRIFTLNCWGLKFVAKDRTERVRAIADYLASTRYDVVCLQELWVYKDFELVRSAVSGHLRFSKFFYSGALGAGLVIFSRFPIIAATIQPYSLNGSPLDVAGGDWFVGKAAASVLLSHPVLGQLQIFNTHLFAKGGEAGPEHRRAHRLVNAWEFAKLAKQSAEVGRYVIAAGDFNSIPTTLPIKVIREHAGLTDAWASLNPPPDPSTTHSTYVNPQEAISVHGVTADSPLCSYSAGKPLDEFARASQGKRLDYVLYRNASHPPTAKFTAQAPLPELMCTNVSVKLTEPVPGQSFSYSDHFGLEATFEIRSREDAGSTLLPDVTSEGVAPGGTSNGAPSTHATSQLSRDNASIMLHALQTCSKHSKVRARRELAVFGGCVAFDVALVVSSAWLRPTQLAVLFVFLGMVSTWLGTTMLYSGFLYGNWEVNALQNVIDELDIYQSSTDAVSRGADRMELYE